MSQYAQVAWAFSFIGRTFLPLITLAKTLTGVPPSLTMIPFTAIGILTVPCIL